RSGHGSIPRDRKRRFDRRPGRQKALVMTIRGAGAPLAKRLRSMSGCDQKAPAPRTSPRGLIRDHGMQLSPSANPIAASPPAAGMQTFRGFAVSAGVAVGPVVILDRRGLPMPTRSIARSAVSSELERLDRGLEEAKAAACNDETEARARLGQEYADILA